MKTVLFAIIILLICVVLLGVKVLFVKDADFPLGHHGDNRKNERRQLY